MRREKLPADTNAPAIALAAAIGVPTNQQGMPDLYRHVPSRFVKKEEAEAAGATLFYDGAACRAGHMAARWVSNISRCADCERLKKGLPTIYPSSRAQNFYAEPRRKPKDAAAPVVVRAAASKPLEPDAQDKKFLAALAESRNFATAASSVGTTVPAVQSRISFNQPLRDAVMDLTERLQIPHPVQVSGTRELTPEEHKAFCRTWVDTGSQSKARAAIGISASQMHDELERSESFRAMFDVAAPRAALALDDTAVDLSLSGNDKLLSKTLPAKLREQYTERIDLRVRQESLTDEQINVRFAQTLKQLFLMAPNQTAQLVQEAQSLARLEQPLQVIDARYESLNDDAETAENQTAGNVGIEGRACAADESAATESKSARSNHCGNSDLI